MKSVKWALLLGLLTAPLAGLPQALETDALSELVQEFVDAFNAHDPDAMAAMVTDDVEWISVRDGAVTVELTGKAALAAAMSEYFASCPSCRSEIRDLMSSAERVSVVEVASWAGRDGTRSQQSMAVYEFSGALVRRVFYFAEEPAAPEGASER